MTTRFRFPLLLALAATLLFACSSEDDSPSSGRPSAPDLGVLPDLDVSTSVDLAFLKPDMATTTTGDKEAAPVIVELTTSMARLTQGEILEVTAIITDPQGFGDIGGGRLFSEQGKLYGAFIGSGGTFKAALSWKAIQDIEATSFEMEQGIPVRAEFFDAALNKTSQTFVLTLHCDGKSACEGVCGESLCGGGCKMKEEFSRDDANCGACGVSCASGASCVEGNCECDSGGRSCDGQCVDIDNNASHCGRCGNACSAGQACSVGFCEDVVGPFERCEDSTQCASPSELGICEKELKPFTDVTLPEKICIFICFNNSECNPGQDCVLSTDQNVGFCMIPCQNKSSCPGTQDCADVQKVIPSFPSKLVCQPMD